MWRANYAPTFVRPALLEAVVLCICSGAAILTLSAGMKLDCTVLCEFGLLSAVAAASAAGLFVRYAVEVCGLLADYRRWEFWGSRCIGFGYLCAAMYAVGNGMLDVLLPRRDPDWISYPGFVSTVVALAAVSLVLSTKYRTLEAVPSRSLLESVSDDTFYLKVGAVTVAALVAHMLTPTWWLDTVSDTVVALLVVVKLRRIYEQAMLAA